MRRTHVVAASACALLLASASAWAGETERPAEVPIAVAERTAEEAGEASEAKAVAEDRGCRDFCRLTEIPVYVPPNRGTTAQRVGGGTRGGTFRS